MFRLLNLARLIPSNVFLYNRLMRGKLFNLGKGRKN